MRAAFPARLEEAADRDDVRVILLTGAGRGFCAGADFAVLSALGQGRADRALPGPRYLVAKTIPKPVIGVVNGACAGLGLVFALACDVRFASPETKFGTGFARRGLVAEQGLAWLLSDLVGPHVRSTCCSPRASSTVTRRWRWAWSTTCTRPRPDARRAGLRPRTWRRAARPSRWGS